MIRFAVLEVHFLPEKGENRSKCSTANSFTDHRLRTLTLGSDRRFCGYLEPYKNDVAHPALPEAIISLLPLQRTATDFKIKSTLCNTEPRHFRPSPVLIPTTDLTLPYLTTLNPFPGFSPHAVSSFRPTLLAGPSITDPISVAQTARRSQTMRLIRHPKESSQSTLPPLNAIFAKGTKKVLAVLPTVMAILKALVAWRNTSTIGRRSGSK